MQEKFSKRERKILKVVVFFTLVVKNTMRSARLTDKCTCATHAQQCPCRGQSLVQGQSILLCGQDIVYISYYGYYLIIMF